MSGDDDVIAAATPSDSTTNVPLVSTDILTSTVQQDSGSRPPAGLGPLEREEVEPVDQSELESTVDACVFYVLSHLNILVVKDLLKHFKSPVYGRKTHLIARLYLTLLRTGEDNKSGVANSGSKSLEQLMLESERKAEVRTAFASARVASSWRQPPPLSKLKEVEAEARTIRSLYGKSASTRRIVPLKDDDNIQCDMRLCHPITRPTRSSASDVPHHRIDQLQPQSVESPTRRRSGRVVSNTKSPPTKRFKYVGLQFYDGGDEGEDGGANLEQDEIVPAPQMVGRNDGGVLSGDDAPAVLTAADVSTQDATACAQLEGNQVPANGTEHVTTGSRSSPERRVCATDVEDNLTRVRLEDVERCPAGKLKRISEFARLLLIVRDNAEVRHNFNASRHSLHRSRLDAKEVLDDFWKADVHRIFSSVEYQPRVQVSSVLSGVDASKPPEDERGSEVLREYFYGLRAFFARAFDKLDRSGWNDGELQTMKGCVLRTEGGKTPGGELTTQGWKSLVVYDLLGMANGVKGNRDFDLIAFFAKMATGIDTYGNLYRISVEGGLPDFDRCNQGDLPVHETNAYRKNLRTPPSGDNQLTHGAMSSGNVIPDVWNPLLSSNYGSRRRSTDSIHKSLEAKFDREMAEERVREDRRVARAETQRVEDCAYRDRLIDILDRTSSYGMRPVTSDTTGGQTLMARVDIQMKTEAGKQCLRQTIQELCKEIKSASTNGYSDGYVTMLKEDLADAEKQYNILRQELSQELNKLCSSHGERLDSGPTVSDPRGNQ